MKLNVLLVACGLATSLVLPTGLQAEPPSILDDPPPGIGARTPIQLPNVPGFLTLKCDFHIHTVFSDGLVWPTVRVEEAWQQGLDAIAITDHIEHQRFRADVSTNRNRSFEIASARGAELDILVIRGGEVTRSMPPGHLNALFLTNVNALAVPSWTNALQVARAQGAFILWNHPGWSPQLTDNKIRWYPEHTELVAADLVHGIEIVNGRDYYPQAHRWAMDKNLALFSNSDIHQPINMEYHVTLRDQRPITLVFARERTLASLKEALFDRRTAVSWGSRLLGEQRFLRPLFDGSIQAVTPTITVAGRNRAWLQIHNNSSIDFTLERIADPPDVTIPAELALPAHKTALLEVSGRGKPAPGTRRVDLSYRVRNFLTAPNEPLPVTIGVEVNFVEAAGK